MNVLPWHKTELERLIGGKGRLPHALLMHGRQGIGKLLFARALAQSLLCENPASSGLACGRCAACGWFDSANHPDFRLIEPASLTEPTEDEDGREKKASLQIIIEQIRELADFINISSHRGGPKVVLIHPAEALNPHAANALLKSLEEPPAGVHFLMVAHRASSSSMGHSSQMSTQWFSRRSARLRGWAMVPPPSAITTERFCSLAWPTSRASISYSISRN